jgi:heme A synthase
MRAIFQPALVVYRRVARAVYSIVFPFTLALAGVTLALVVLGGIVHNTGSSLACPDWPLCNGTAFPRMVGAVLIEHGHRLTALAVVVGTVLVVMALAERKHPAARVAWLALGLVIVQALLGAVTVKLRLPPMVSTGHLATSMLYLSTVIFLALRLRPAPGAALPAHVRQMTAATAVLIYAQMVLGAAVRHLGAGLACRELWTCNGRLWPTGIDYTLELHMLHRFVAAAVLLAATATAIATFRAAAGRTAVRALALAAPFLVLVQMTLGILTIISYRDIVPLTAHLGVAALLFGNAVALHLVSRGQLGAVAPSPFDGEELPEGVAA